jgi:hypothetical protein
MLSNACAFKLFVGLFFSSSITCLTCSCALKKLPIQLDISLAILVTSLPAALASL